MDKFDVIVVGAGSSGGVVAARLIRKRLAQRLAPRGRAGFPARGDSAAALHLQRRAPLARRRRDTGVRLGLRQHRRRRHARRAQPARAARTPGRRHVDDQRDDRGARRAVRFRSLGGDGKQGMGVGRPAAAVHRDRERRQFWRGPDPWPRRADRHPALSAAELGARQPRHVRRLPRAWRPGSARTSTRSTPMPAWSGRCRTTATRKCASARS